MQIRTLIASVSALAIAGSALGDVTQTLQIDTNALTAQASGPMSTSFTGHIDVFNRSEQGDQGGGDLDPNARILDLLIDGARQNTGGAATDAFNFNMSLDFIDGNIVEGSIQVGVDANASENIYSTQVVPVDDGSIIEFGGSFLIGGTTFDGEFASPAGSFLDVGVSPWGSTQPAQGTFAFLAYEPDGAGFDANADVDVYIVTPTPGTLAMLGTGLLVAARRRRSAA